MADSYKETRVFRYPNMIARVHVPELMPDERNRRMEVIQKAAARLLLSTEKSSRGSS